MKRKEKRAAHEKGKCPADAADKKPLWGDLPRHSIELEEEGLAPGRSHPSRVIPCVMGSNSRLKRGNQRSGKKRTMMLPGSRQKGLTLLPE